MKKVLIYLLSGIVILAVLSEIFLRVFFYEQLKTQNYPLIYKLDPNIGYTHIPNCQATICIPSIEKKFKLNNHGFYGKDFTDLKRINTRRIVFVGNSLTEGIWLNEKENYPMILQKKFEENGQKNIEVINCSYGGINKDIRNYKHILYNVTKWEPDFVFFNIGLIFQNENEHRENYKGYMLRHSGTKKSRQKAIDAVEQLKNKKLFTFFYDISWLYRAYCKNFYEKNNCPFSEDIRLYREKAFNSPDIVTYRFSYSTSMKLLKDLDLTLKKENCKLVIFQFGNSSYFKTSMDSLQIASLSLAINFDKSMLHLYDGHPNGKGHMKIAESLYKMIFEIFVKEKNTI